MVRPEDEQPAEESADLFDFDSVTVSAAEKDQGTARAVAEALDLNELVDALPDLSDGGAKAKAEPGPSKPVQTLVEDSLDAEPPAPVADAVPTPARLSTARLSPALIAVLLGLTLLNVLIVGLAWNTNRKLAHTVSDIGRSVVQTAEGLRAETAERSRELFDIVRPVVTPDAAEGRTFERVQEDLARGDFAMARRRLYGLLAMADSLDESERSDAEAQASFMLAETLVARARALRAEETP